VLLWSIGTGVKCRADSSPNQTFVEGFAPDLARVQNWRGVTQTATAVAHAIARFCAGIARRARRGRGIRGEIAIAAASDGTRNLRRSDAAGSQIARRAN
jgi:hypothetical protein